MCTTAFAGSSGRVFMQILTFPTFPLWQTTRGADIPGILLLRFRPTYGCGHCKYARLNLGYFTLLVGILLCVLCCFRCLHVTWFYSLIHQTAGCLGNNDEDLSKLADNENDYLFVYIFLSKWVLMVSTQCIFNISGIYYQMMKIYDNYSICRMM